ncbi:hemagglutinin repeat-containing protein [Budviciaceae bacterium CWB-B4]|uniref:Hemagglutinin repeat-containing protein n=1 Tax=Limnobaculum xujianqingii TaxID=2738837 RepID=A0A9D7FUW9_9GAMM|nr:hemagglutinin repeat-containing protein [Limnobaculum xujianqingii]MBK5073804.1 hemagglutinin repeat-containing protein [Limnobaculum xujianqingii]MBK5177302.1 hemagglutinin repeat-containing protein [Limnobaculum xujianqingii]
MKNNMDVLPVSTRRRVLSYLISALLCIQPIAPALAAGIDVASGNTHTDNAPNGVPVVNIATPNGAGVSHNQYQNFNVGKEGLILNNATGALNQTQLGGLIQNNPNLKAGQEANAIINEVVGANRSQLQGYTEVAGKQANVMVANPYGITCSGCGFINTPNVTLTTGKPVLDAQGNVQALEVSKGTITIEGQGLDASNNSSLAIISRATEVNAAVYAKDLSVISGSNRVGSDGSITPIAGEGAAPRVAIDTGALGGMYANRIHMVSSEKGVGVNLGNLNARQGDIQLDANGKLTLNNTLSQGNLTLQADELALQGNHKAGGDIRLTSRGQTEIKQGAVSSAGNVTLNSQGQITVGNGTVAAGNNVSLNTQQSLQLNSATVAAGVNAEGAVGSQGTAQLDAQHQLWNNSQISAGQVKAKGQQSIQQDAASHVTGLTNVSLEGGHLALDGNVSAGQNIALSGTRLQTGAQSKIQAQQNLNVATTERVDSLGEMSSGNSLSLSTGEWGNQGLFATNGNSTINATSLNNQGKIQAQGSQNITAGTVNNSGIMLSGGQTVLTGDNVTLSGSLGSQQGLNLTARQWLKVEPSGLLLSDGSMTLQSAQLDLAGSAKAQQDIRLNTTTLNTFSGSQLLSDAHIAVMASASTLAGLISAGGTFSLYSPLLTALDTAHIQARQGMALNASQSALLQGTLASGGGLTLTSADINQQGIMQSDAALTLYGTTINQQGTLQGQNVSVNVQTLTNSGTVLALNQLDVNTQLTDNQSSGRLFSGGNLTLISDVLNHSGQILALTDISVRLNQDFTHSSTIAAGNSLSLSTAGALTQNGTLQGQSVSLTSGGKLTSQGKIAAGSGTLSLNAADIELGDNSNLQSGGNIEITSQNSITHSGFTGAAGDLRLSAVNDITNSSLLYAAGDMQLFADKISNLKGDILAGNSLWMQKDAAGNANSLVLNSSGTIETIDGDITINTGHLLNERDGLTVTQTERDLISEYDWLSSTEATLSHDDVALDLYGYWYAPSSNDNGGDFGYFVHYFAPALNEWRKELAVAVSSIAVTSNGKAGRIASGRDLVITSGRLDNYASDILANGDAYLSGGSLNNQSWFSGSETQYQTYQYKPNTLDGKLIGDLINYTIIRDSEGKILSYYDVDRDEYIRFTSGNFVYTATGDRRFERSDDSELYRSTIQAGGNLYASFDNDISNTTTVANAGNISHSLEAPALSGFGDLSLPNGLNGLFITSQDPDSPYLITTNPKLDGLGGLDNSLFNDLYGMLGMRPGSAPYETDSRFTDKNKVIGSAYFLDRLNLNPDYDYRFLGDAAFDTRYISDAMLKQTGSRYINGVGSDLSQMQYLIDNAAQAYGSLRLTFGVSLTAEQIARLDKSIVWWEPMTIQGQTVLAPKLYLAKNDVTAVSGSVIKGGHVELEAGRVINSNGSILADNSLFIDSWSTIDNINAGQIKAGGYLSMFAMDDINNIGSTIRGQQVALESLDGSIINRTETQQWSVSGNAGGFGLNSKNQTLAFSQTDVGDIASIQSEGCLSLNAGKNIELTASEVSTEKGPLTLSAGQDINILTAQQSQSVQVGKNKTEAQGVLSSSLVSGGSLNMAAGRDINAQAAEITAEDSVSLAAGRDVNLTTAESREYQETHGKRKQEITESVRQQGTEIVSGKHVQIIAGQDINAQAASVTAKEDIYANAGRDINILTATESDYRFFEETKKKSGFMSKTVTHKVEQDYATYEKGSLLSGDNVTLSAGNDLNITGSSVIGDGDLKLKAGNNVNILAAVEEQSTYRLNEKKKSGVFSGGGLGFTIGTTSSRHQIDDASTTQSQSASMIGSTGGSVSILAGGQAHIGGSDVIASKDINIIADNVLIDPGHDLRQRDEKYEQKTQGLSLALSGVVGGAINSGFTAAQQAKDESDDRLAALNGVKSALYGVQAVQGAVLDNLKDVKDKSDNLIGISASIGSQKSSSQQHLDQNTIKGSALNAGNNLNIIAYGKGDSAASGDIVIAGSQLKAGGDTTLSAKRDILLTGAANTQKTTGKNSSSGGAIGVSVGVGTEGKMGVSIFANANKSSGHEKGDGTQWAETTIDTGNQLTINSQRDTALIGALVSGEQVTMNVGRDLWLQSQQDSDNYDAKQQSVSGGISIPIWGSNAGGNFSYSRDKMHSTYDSVQEQTGIYAGLGGFDITVGNHTQLDGAVISSTASADKNQLDTGTLGFSNIENKAEFKTEHQGVGISAGGDGGGKFIGNVAGGMIAAGGNDGSASGTTQAAISDGTIIIRDRENQQQDIADLSRDVENANGSISPIFDKEKEQNRLKEIQLIGEIGGQMIDIVATQGAIYGEKAKKDPAALAQAEADLRAGGLAVTQEAIEKKAYENGLRTFGTGSNVQRATQAAVAALQGLAGGDMSQALAGAAAPYVANVIKDLTKGNDEANIMAHAVLGAVVAHVNGNSALAGATGAAMGEYIAKQLYPDTARDMLTEEQRQTISLLSTVAAGLAGGVTGDSTADAFAGAQAGKNAVENNALGRCDPATCFDTVDVIGGGGRSTGASGGGGGAVGLAAILAAIFGDDTPPVPNVGGNLTDAEKTDMGGTGSGTPGGWGPEDEQDARNRGQHEEYKDELRQGMEKPSVKDSNLSNIIDDLYRPNAKVGSGSTADAVRYELATGNKVGGRGHVEKAQTYSKALQDWLNKNPKASPGDRAAAENVLKDLQNSLRGK